MQKKDILVIDDDPTVLEIITELLQNQGYQVYGATHIAEAMEAFQIHQDTIGLAMIDIVLDNEYGFDLADQLVETFQFDRFVFFTAYFWQEKIVEEFKQRGAVFFEKPLKFQKEILPFLSDFFGVQPDRG